MQRSVDAAGGAADRDIDRLGVEELLQHAELAAVDRQRNHREVFDAARCLQLQRVLQLLAEPLRLQTVGADDHRQPGRRADGGFDLGPERIPAAQLARIDPAVLTQIGQALAKTSHQIVVLRAVRDEELAGHARLPGAGASTSDGWVVLPAASA
ncbi:MAG TPA: hypothetical protein PLW24_02360 [Burkholderiaceae bacterium]|nr:hypothetical protein [Burkholderiaceae bacterium]